VTTFALIHGGGGSARERLGIEADEIEVGTTTLSAAFASWLIGSIRLR
jgi:hypothetical protein